jgi:hypothetical protein
MISLKLCDEMELVLEFAFSTFRLNAVPSTSYFTNGTRVTKNIYNTALPL